MCLEDNLKCKDRNVVVCTVIGVFSLWLCLTLVFLVLYHPRIVVCLDFFEMNKRMLFHSSLGIVIYLYIIYNYNQDRDVILQKSLRFVRLAFVCVI